MRTQVGIVGGGPAGTLLSHLLHLRGIESVVIELRGREEVETTVRAGVLEDATAALLRETGVGERMNREGAVHEGIELRFGGRGHRIDLADLTGQSIVVYGQQEVVKDLYAARLEAGGSIMFETATTGLRHLDTDGPSILFRGGARLDPEAGEVRFRDDAEEEDLACDFVVGADGFFGPSRRFFPGGTRQEHARAYPFGWFGILVEGPPATKELIYCLHERGFALVSTRSPRHRGRLDAHGGQDLPEEHRPDALLCLRADAPRAPLPRRRRGPHRPPDRRQGHEPGRRRRPRPRRGALRLLRLGPHGRPRLLLGDVPAPRVEGEPVLVVDDLDAPPLPRRGRLSLPHAARRARLRNGLARRGDLPRRELRGPAHGAAVPRAGPRVQVDHARRVAGSGPLTRAWSPAARSAPDRRASRARIRLLLRRQVFGGDEEHRDAPRIAYEEAAVAALGRDARGPDPPADRGDVLGPFEHHRPVAQSDHAFRNGRYSFPAPDVEAEVVVVAAGRHEGGGARHERHELEAQGVAVEVEASLQVPDVQVHVADHEARADFGPRILALHGR